MSRDTSWGYGNSFDAILAQLDEERKTASEPAKENDASDMMSRVKVQHEATVSRLKQEMNKDERPKLFGIPVALAKPKAKTTNHDGVDRFFGKHKDGSNFGDLWGGKKAEPHKGTVWGGNTNTFWGGTDPRKEANNSFWGHKKDDNSGGGWGW